MNSFNENEIMNNNLAQVKYLKKSKKKKLYNSIIFIIIFLICTLILYLIMKIKRLQRIIFETNHRNNETEFENLQNKLKYESEMPHLNKVIKKRIFDRRIPLPKEIKCNPHFIDEE
jgi:predicted PurR-regulated permease PerM